MLAFSNGRPNGKGQTMPAQILQVTLQPDTDPDAFENRLLGTIIPEIQILRRTVQSTSCRVFRAEADGTQPVSYVVLVLAQIVGAPPETPILSPFDLPDETLSKLSKELAGQATVKTLGEVSPLAPASP